MKDTQFKLGRNIKRIFVLGPVDVGHGAASGDHHGRDGRAQHEAPVPFRPALHRIRTLRHPPQFWAQRRVRRKPSPRFITVRSFFSIWDLP